MFNCCKINPMHAMHANLSIFKLKHDLTPMIESCSFHVQSRSMIINILPLKLACVTDSSSLSIESILQILLKITLISSNQCMIMHIK